MQPSTKLLRLAAWLAYWLLAGAGGALHADSPQATITAPSAAISVATNQSMAFSAVSTDSTGFDVYLVNSFSWSFGDGSLGSGASTGHAFAVPGTYTVTLTVAYTGKTCIRMDTKGNCTGYRTITGTATATRTVTVLAPPTINAFSASTVSVGSGKPVTLTWSTTGATSLDLSGVGSVTGTSTVVHPDTPTTYTLTVRNAVASASASVTVTTYTVGVSISPGSADLLLGESRSFTALVSPSNLGVTWEATGGALSSITAVGATFKATESGGPFQVKATSVEDSSKSASATIRVAAVSVGTPVPVPANAATFVGGGVSFSALVSGAVDQGVTWSVDGGRGGTIDPSGVFTANEQGAWTVVARSVADPTRSASAGVLVQPLTVTVNPATATVRSGQTQAFSATVTGPGSPSPAVLWRVSSPGGGNITDGGVYTAPDAPGDYTLTAISAQDGNCAGRAVVHVPGWVLKWKKDVVYVGARELGEVDAAGLHVTLMDHLGSPRFLLDATGTLECEQKFLPFGESLTDPASAAKFAKGFTNHEQTDASGLIYMQARFYAPWYGRFLSPDPARDQHFEETQSWNIYSYVQNNPVMKTDPTGLAMIDLEGLKKLVSKTWDRLTGNKTPSASTKTSGPVVTPGRKIWISKTPDGGDNKGTRVDDGKGNNKGECVSLVKHDNPGMPSTKSFHLGMQVKGNEEKIIPGTAVVEFNNGKDWKARGHVGEFLGKAPGGFTMTDQYNTGKGHDIGPSYYSWEGRGPGHPQSQGKRYHVLETSPK